MTEHVRAILYGVGEMGRLVTPMLLDKGVQIVGAVDVDPDKVGKDLGAVAGLADELRVPVEDDAARVLGERSADIVLMAVASYLTDLYEHIALCVEHGHNVVTIGEEVLYSWTSSPALTARIDRLAKAKGVTVTGSGHQDAYWVNLVSLLMGTAHRVDAVHGVASWNVDDYGAEVARDAHVGESAEEFDRFLREEGWPPGFSRNALEAIAADIGLRVVGVEERTRPVLAEQEVRSEALDTLVPAGRVSGFVEEATLRTAEGVELSFEMVGRIYRKGEADTNDWVVRGDPPELRLSNPGVPTMRTTCTQFVNRIPDVINARPGYVPVHALPKLTYRALPLHAYLRA